MSDDAAAASRALLHWAAVRWPEQPPTSLEALAQRVGSGAAAVRELDQVLYAPVRRPWQGRALWEAFQQGLDDGPKRKQVDGDALSPLYPERE